MYALVSGHGLVNHTIRSALPSLIPLLADALRYTEAQRVLLLGAFFPGYILTQLPGGWATQRWGGKFVITVNLYSNAVLFFLTPLAARLGSAGSVAALFIALGLSQGSYVPSCSVLIKAWMPSGAARPWALRAMELGSRVAPLIAATSVPTMAARWGWAAVPQVYGALSLLFAILWHLTARDRPPLEAGSIAAGAGAGAGAGTTKAVKTTGVEWAVFRLAPVQVCIWSHFASNATLATMYQQPASRFEMTDVYTVNPHKTPLPRSRLYVSSADLILPFRVTVVSEPGFVDLFDEAGTHGLLSTSTRYLAARPPKLAPSLPSRHSCKTLAIL